MCSKGAHYAYTHNVCVRVCVCMVCVLLLTPVTCRGTRSCGHVEVLPPVSTSCVPLVTDIIPNSTPLRTGDYVVYLTSHVMYAHNLLPTLNSTSCGRSPVSTSDCCYLSCALKTKSRGILLHTTCAVHAIPSYPPCRGYGE